MRLTTKIISGFFLFAAFFLTLSFSAEEPAEETIAGEKRLSDRGLYITAYMADAPKHFGYIRRQAGKSGLNTIVVDVKRKLSEPLVQLAKERKLDQNTKVTPDPWLAKLVNELHREGFIVSVRLVVFKDDHLVIARPDLAVRIKGGKLYRDFKWGRWADPYSDEVRLYNELVAERAALSGVDEVQFDYIRFPAEGRAHLAYFPFQKEGVNRVQVINSFLKSVRERLQKYNVSIAVDIFGIIAWQRQVDIDKLGQDLKKMSPYIDVISPMLYPSHFAPGYDGYENPGEHPYHFMYVGVKKVLDIIGTAEVKVVPWLQGFNMNSPNFGPGYILSQIQACLDAGTGRYLVWNASNRYEATFAALRTKKNYTTSEVGGL